MEDSLLTGYYAKLNSDRFTDLESRHHFQLSSRQMRRLDGKIKLINNHINLIFACTPALNAMGQNPDTIIRKFWRSMDIVGRMVLKENPPTKNEFFEWYFSSE